MGARKDRSPAGSPDRARRRRRIRRQAAMQAGPQHGWRPNGVRAPVTFSRPPMTPASTSPIPAARHAGIAMGAEYPGRRVGRRQHPGPPSTLPAPLSTATPPTLTRQDPVAACQTIGLPLHAESPWWPGTWRPPPVCGVTMTSAASGRARLYARALPAQPGKVASASSTMGLCRPRGPWPAKFALPHSPTTEPGTHHHHADSSLEHAAPPVFRPIAGIDHHQLPGAGLSTAVPVRRPCDHQRHHAHTLCAARPRRPWTAARRPWTSSPPSTTAGDRAPVYRLCASRPGRPGSLTERSRQR